MDLQSKIEEARQRRILGFYNDSVKLLEGVLVAEPSIPVEIEIAVVNLERGLVGACYDRLIGIHNRLEQEVTDVGDLAMAEMFLASSMSGSTAKVKTPLKRATEVYARYLHNREVDAYDEKLVSSVSTAEPTGIVLTLKDCRRLWLPRSV